MVNRQVVLPMHDCVTAVVVPLTALQSHAAPSLGTNHFCLVEKGEGIVEGYRQDVGH